MLVSDTECKNCLWSCGKWDGGSLSRLDKFSCHPDLELMGASTLASHCGCIDGIRLLFKLHPAARALVSRA